MIPYSLRTASYMPAWNRGGEYSDGILNFNYFSVVGIIKQGYVRETHLLITDLCIKKDSRGESKEIHGWTDQIKK